MSVVRGRPPGLAGGMSGSIRRGWSSLSAWPDPKSPTSQNPQPECDLQASTSRPPSRRAPGTPPPQPPSPRQANPRTLSKRVLSQRPQPDSLLPVHPAQLLPLAQSALRIESLPLCQSLEGRISHPDVAVIAPGGSLTVLDQHRTG